MLISARDLYKALKAFSPLPKTFTIKYVIIQTDTLIGKTREKPDGTSKHALVMIETERESVTVDFDMLRDFTKKMGNKMLDIQVNKQSTLKMHYPNGDFVLFHISGTPGVTLDLNSMVERETVVKV